MKKLFLIVLVNTLLLIIIISSSVYAASGLAVICYNDTNLAYASHMYTDSRSHISDMGYICRGHDSIANNMVLQHLQSSNIFVAVGHASPGALSCGGDTYITGTYQDSTGKYMALNAIPDSSLSNVKLALWYGCNLGSTDQYWGNVVDISRNKGVKCAVGWTVTTVIGETTEWNRLFFEKAREDTVVEGFRHADFWIQILSGLNATKRMQSRHETGDIYQTIY